MIAIGVTARWRPLKTRATRKEAKMKSSTFREGFVRFTSGAGTSRNAFCRKFLNKHQLFAGLELMGLVIAWFTVIGMSLAVAAFLLADQ